MNKIVILLLIFSLEFHLQTNGERTKDKMYEYIESAAACFRRLNATHQTGCTSKRPGSTGVIHVIHNENETEDFNFVFKDGPAPPYVPIIGVDQLNNSLINKFKAHSDRIAGIVLHRNITRPMEYSNEQQCPNQKSNLEGSCSAEKPWNPAGTALMHANIPFPVFLVQDEHNLKKIIDCFERFNNYDHEHQGMRALCALELAAFMFATNDSQTCIRRSNSVTTFTPTRFCDPLGSRNVWATLQPRVNKTEVILVSAQLDTATMFYDVTPGAVSPLSGLVTLLTTAHILKQMVKETEETYNTTVMFVLFNGETFDYIGSQRFIYDIVENSFPMKKSDEITKPLPKMSLSDIKLIIDLGQLNMNTNKELFVHHIKYDQSNEIDKFKLKMSEYAKNFNINLHEPVTNGNRLPPASLQSFLRENKTIEGVVLASHDQEFTNKYYHSFYDDKENLGFEYQNNTKVSEESIQQYIFNISSILAHSLYEEISGKPYNPKSNQQNDNLDTPHLVDELLHCYLDTANCSIYQSVLKTDSFVEEPLGLYVSVDPHGNKVTSITAYILAWITGDIKNITKDNCTSDPHNAALQYMWMSENLTNMTDSVCFLTTMDYTLAVSPAFVITDYDWKSNRYSTWTESIWRDIYMRMFLIPSHRHEVMTISVGTVTFVLSLALVYFVHTRADILFAKPDAITPGTSC